MELPTGLATSLLDGFPLEVAVLDGTGEVVWVNRACREYGRRHGRGTAVVGRDFLDVTASLVDEPHAGRIREGIDRILASERGGCSVEYPCHDDRELRWYSMYATALEHEGRDYCLVAQEDVTDRRISDMLTEARREEAATLNRMLTHEVRNAVGSAAGWLGLLETDPGQADRVERIAAALDRIERVVDDSAEVLDMAYDRSSLERVPIGDLTEAAWSRADRGDVSLEVAESFPVICYPRQTETLLESLFDSASGGSSATTVRIRLGDREFHVEDDRSEPVPADPERAFAETPIHRDGRLSFGLSLARPLALLNGWQLSLGPSPLDGWGFTVRTEQAHA
ncbi:hypothetical protein BRC93_14985 [Halobacteriales archaeon QS_5_70_15]|nr:MAG: hypothetical protein BRC93_14985 [Halobacteriales archaeon QS_5_70_15]